MDNFYVGIGETQVKDPQAHVRDERAMIRGYSNGLTKRELFAAMAMQGILSRMPGSIKDQDPVDISIIAIQAANALIKELEK